MLVPPRLAAEYTADNHFLPTLQLNVFLGRSGNLKGGTSVLNYTDILAMKS